MWAALVTLAACAAFVAGQDNSCLGKLSVGVDNVVVCPAKNCSVANASVLWCLSPPGKCLESRSGEQVMFMSGTTDVYVNEMGELVVTQISKQGVINTTCTYLLGNDSVCDPVSFNITQNIGKLELRPLINLMHVIANGKTLDVSKLTLYVGVTYVVCYSGNMFGYDEGSPVYWIKDGERFNDSVLIRSESELCLEYLGYLESTQDLFGLDIPVQSFVNMYRSDPCLLYDDHFTAILRIQSFDQKDSGVYDFYLRNQDEVAVADGELTLDNIEYISTEPTVAPLPRSVIEIGDNSSIQTVCVVNSSIGVNPVWLIPSGEKADYVNTTCDNAGCFCTGTTVGIFFRRITNEIHESSMGAIISQHHLVLFVCNVNQSFNGSYTCMVDDVMNGFDAVNQTFMLLVAPVESNNQPLLVSLVVAGSLLLIVVLVVIATVAGYSLCIKRYFHKSGVDRVVDLPISGHLNPYWYDTKDNMEFPRDSLVQLELLGEGQFGQVFKAQASGIVPGDKTRNIVAVKTVKENALNIDVNDLYAELEIMKKMEPHPNILNLLGYCTRPFNDPPLIIMEFALHGNLKSFLRRYKRDLFRLPSDASSQYSPFTALSREHTPAPNSPVGVHPPHPVLPAIVVPTPVAVQLQAPAPPPIQSITEYLEICGGEETVCTCEDRQECSCDAQRDGKGVPLRNQWYLYSSLPLGENTVLRHHLPLDEPTYYNQTDGSGDQYEYQYQYQYGYQSTPYYNLPGPHQLYYNQSHSHSHSSDPKFGPGGTSAEGRRDSIQQSPPATSVCSCDWEGEKVLFRASPEADVPSENQDEVDSPRPISQKSISTNIPGGLRDVDFLNFALQISYGMEHLERMKCLHRDLAARNVLIAEGFLLKIADFGLARELTDKDYYRKRTSGKLPARWMAVESLSSERIHTHKSDVWSFGVLLWELFTYGSLPYGRGDVASTLESLLQHLVEGHRLPKPDHCSNDMYQIMHRCWMEDPAKRPSFSKLVLLFDHMLSTAHGYLQMSEEESMQAKSSLDRLIDQRRRPSMDLIVEESPSVTIATAAPLRYSHFQNAHPGASPSRNSNCGSSSVPNTSSTAFSSIANGNLMAGAAPLHVCRTPPIPETKNLQETTV